MTLKICDDTNLYFEKFYHRTMLSATAKTSGKRCRWKTASYFPVIHFHYPTMIFVNIAHFQQHYFVIFVIFYFYLVLIPFMQYNNINYTKIILYRRNISKWLTLLH